jgi:N-acetylneuraminic acid mutarotase
MAYDIESDRVIIFGSDPEGADWRQTNCNETWAYDYNTNTWTRLADGPGKHIGARIAYDAESDRIILFGGINGSTYFLYDDTWAYDFNSDTWTRMDPPTRPPGRNYQGLTYDAKADRVLTYGGETLEGEALESLWAYDFNTDTWQEMVPGEQPFPGYRDYSTLVYDSESDRSILFGGLTQAQSSGEVWSYEYGTNTWTKLESSLNPGKISRHALVYIPATDRSILFGGWVGPFEERNETWSYDLNTNTWTNMTP